MFPGRIDVTNVTGSRVSTQMTAWVTPNGNMLVEHLAGRDPNGNLLVFYWMPGSDWQVVDVSQKTGKQVSGPVTSWVTPNGNMLVEHLAGRDPNGNLLVFYWMPGSDWQVVDVSQKTGKQVSGPVTSWVTPNGNMLVEHLAGRDPNGNLLVFYWSPEHDWQVKNATSEADTPKRMAGPLCSWLSQNGNLVVEHLAGPSETGELLVFYWMPGQHWKVVDVTAITGVSVQGTPRTYQVNKAGVVEELLVIQGMNGSMYKMWWRPGLDWQAMDFKEAIGIDFSTSPEVWTTPDGNNIIEHIAVADNNGNLIVSWFDSEPRRITDNLVNDFPPLQPQREKRRMVAILWDPKRPTDPAPSRASVENAFIGNVNSVRQFFKESSLGRFSFQVVQFLPPPGAGKPDWYPAKRPANHYWGPDDPNDLNGDGFIHGHVEKWAEAVWAASADFNFNAYDTSGSGKLDPNELLLCMCIPQNSAAGFQRTPSGREFPAVSALKSDGVNTGVEIPTILEIYLGGPHTGLICHELSHLLAGAGDLYHGWPPESQYVPFNIGPFSLMATGMPGNLDPFHRLKFGWLRHRLVMRSGHYALRAAVTHGEALVLMDKRHSTKEYFLLENRWKAPNTCDANLPDAGLAVWHIIEDSNVFNQSPTPAGTDPAYWNTTAGQWGRRGVRLIRAVVTPPQNNDTQALWDGSQPATAYDLLSDDPNPQHSRLRWVTNTAAGNPSGFAIRNISAAGPVMEFDLQVPW